MELVARPVSAGGWEDELNEVMGAWKRGVCFLDYDSASAECVLRDLLLLPLLFTFPSLFEIVPYWRLIEELLLFANDASYC